MRMLTISCLALAGLLAGGCGTDDSAGPGGVDADSAEPARQSMAVERLAVTGEGSAAGFAQAPAPPRAPAALPAATQTGASETMIIRSGHASIEVDSLEQAIAQVQRIAAAVNGVVGNTTLTTGEHDARSATIELRIPSNRFDEALSGLEPLGTLESVNTHAQDVSEEFVDLAARTGNARRLEERLVELLARRTGKLEEVLAVERELARIREEIERLEGRMKFIQSRVATSTLVINLHEPLPIASAPGQNVLADAFREAWRNFVSLVAFAIASTGVLIPLAAIGVPLVLWLRRRNHTSRMAGS